MKILISMILCLALASACQRQAAWGFRRVAPATNSPTPTLTVTGTATATTVPPTDTATFTAVPTATPTATDSATATPSATPSPTWTPAPVTLQMALPLLMLQYDAKPLVATATPSVTPTPTETPIPLPTPDGVARQAILPVLMYHYVSEPPRDAGPLRRDLSVSPTAFEAQLRYFREAGYTSITLYDLVMYLQIGQPLPPKPILLTFDDGYSDHYENAFPLLKRYGFVGTFFVITGFADERRPAYLSWDQIREMGAAGMEFGAHSYTHPDLRGQTVDYLVWQTLGPKQALEERVPSPVIAFCYPFGWYDEQTIRVVQSAQYWVGVTTGQGMLHLAHERFELKRVRVRGSDTVWDLATNIDYLRQEALRGVPTPTPLVSPTPIYHPTSVFQRQGLDKE